MERVEFEHRLTETESRSRSNTHRINELSVQIEAVNKLATSVAVMAEQLKTMNENVDALTGKVDVLEAKPGKRYDELAGKVIWAVAAALIAFALGRIGL